VVGNMEVRIGKNGQMSAAKKFDCGRMVVNIR